MDGAITRADGLVERTSDDAALAVALQALLPWLQTPLALVAYVAGPATPNEEDRDEDHDHPGNNANDFNDGLRVHSVVTFIHGGIHGGCRLREIFLIRSVLRVELEVAPRFS